MATHKYTIKGYRRKEESRTLCPQVETIEEGDEVIITVGKNTYRAIATIKDSNDPCRSCLLSKLCLVDEFCPVDEDNKVLCGDGSDMIFMSVDDLMEDI